MSFFRFGAALAFLLALALTTADVASARVGSGSSFGSRGTRTFTPPPTTNTAPKTADPINKSITNPAASAPTAPAASRFGGLRGLLLGGLIAAALGGIFGFGVLAHIVGFVLQLLLIAGLVWLVMAYLRSRRTGAPLFARGAAAGPPIDLAYPNGATRPNGSARAATPSQALNISQQDLDTFERLLGEVQTAFSREDTQRLGRMATPEMLSHFSQELADNARRGVRNEVSRVALLQGDVSEAWREPGSDYATVAMRYALRDTMVDRGSGRIVSGDPDRDDEVTELWTFRRDDRDPGAGWQLSAIQQS
ncbi:MAG TPA: Tim44 domain-containing protein [Hyphomicrobiaceae bacterium]|nr:Tim44 domain-containing protein [Hyphomicrobiaceae bacterium]